MLYAAEPTWRGQDGVEDEHQRAINRMGRSTLSAWSSTLREIVAWESGLSPARALLNHCQATFTQRLHARPRSDYGSGDGPEEILTRERADLTMRLRAAATLGRRQTVEAQVWGTDHLFPGKIVVDSRAGGLQTASEWRQQDTL